VYKKPHSLEEFRRKSAVRIEQFPEKNSRELKSSAVVLSAFGQKGNIFSMFCSTGELLLDILEVIITANLFLSSFIDC